MALFRRRKKTTTEAPEAEQGITTEVDTADETETPGYEFPIPPLPGPDGLRSVDAHRDFLLSAVEELPPFGQQLLDASGLSLCEDVVSSIDLPGFDNSAMDGYAVQVADTESASNAEPVVLAVVGEVAAGQTATHRLSPGTAMKIMTGAPIPDGAEAVVRYEDTDRGADDVLIYVPATEGLHIRRRGEDLSAGDQVFTAGDRLEPGAIGLLAAIGLDKAMVRPRPRVVVLATGSELVAPGTPLTSAGQLYDSNSYLLAAAARQAGAQVFRVGVVSDDPDEIRQTIHDQLIRADLIITSGGVSQGDHDVVKQVMPEMGWTDFSQVAMQPGKPQGFGLIGDSRVPMIMVPGNPVSSFVSFEVFVRPVIRKLRGAFPLVRPLVRAVAGEAMTSLPGKRQFARGVVTVDEHGQRIVRPVGGHGSHLIGDLAHANCLIVLDEETEHIDVDEAVSVWPIGED